MHGGSPWVAFAYNTVTQAGGQITTSPVLSEDGTKVAFVESTSGASYFHVLVLPNPIPAPPSQSGTVLSPLTPTSCAQPTTPGCMTTLTIETTASNSNSSPWVDYAPDAAYVGAGNGVLYKITPVFGGAPALVSTGGWPVTVSTQPTKVLTAPVVDDTAGRIFIGDGYGYLYGVNLTNPGTFPGAGDGWMGGERRGDGRCGSADCGYGSRQSHNRSGVCIYRVQHSAGHWRSRQPDSSETSRVPPPSRQAIQWIWAPGTERRLHDGQRILRGI